ncbi:1-acyl-sn-glycerol-3-phosphate acyltransferase [Corallococcus praedator]|uniref:1-acyl-sn-glycerol-3-phosphate acyltransferase n=1 Tax=Corallococcus praedator TaxID=2316724 RepID=A0ABX9QK53_9BACT|nr:1-acyl-sn-glycerol-3-phosphate acyltransferase [Corallococcus sp. CA047B]RKH28837.1 1-acyl-sn-glycerol-3-phosphate acyltransferase [Corallococcus sp. CA031C]RKI08430.1 1-acyl-sn-glycerol-3-phosphate acyltransferase [Corallococcus praedator]
MGAINAHLRCVDPPIHDRVGIIRILLSIAFWLFFALSSAVLFLGALLVWALTRPFDADGRVLHLYSCFWAQLYFYVNPLWNLKVEGRDRLPWKGAAVLVANHESLGDILVLFGLYRPFKWVSKAENFKLPLIGWNMRLNRYVPLIRGDRASIIQMMAGCERWLARGIPILMFPEGTRSKDGEVKAFKDGAFTLSIQQRCPIIPVVLTGTARTMPKHGLVIQQAVHARVRVLEPIDPAGFAGDVHALRDHVRDVIVSEKARMEAER